MGACVFLLLGGGRGRAAHNVAPLLWRPGLRHAVCVGGCMEAGVSGRVHLGAVVQPMLWHPCSIPSPSGCGWWGLGADQPRCCTFPCHLGSAAGEASPSPGLTITLVMHVGHCHRSCVPLVMPPLALLHAIESVILVLAATAAPTFSCSAQLCWTPRAATECCCVRATTPPCVPYHVRATWNHTPLQALQPMQR